MLVGLIGDLVPAVLGFLHGAAAVHSSCLLGTFADEPPTGGLGPFLFGGHQTVRYSQVEGRRRIPDRAADRHRQWREPAIVPELDSP